MAISAVRKGAAAEGMKVRDYIWRGHDPTAVAVMTEVIGSLVMNCRSCSAPFSVLGDDQVGFVPGMQDGAAVTGLAIAAASLVAVNTTGNPVYDPIGSIIVGNLLGMVCYVQMVSFQMILGLKSI